MGKLDGKGGGNHRARAAESDARWPRRWLPRARRSWSTTLG